MSDKDTNEDFYYDERGRFVMTAQYHLKRGYCCGNGCKHCPYEYENVPEPGKSKLIAKQKSAAENYGYEEPS